MDSWPTDDEYDDTTGLPEYTPSPIGTLARLSRSNTTSSAGTSAHSHGVHWKYPTPSTPLPAIPITAPQPLNVPRRSQTRPTRTPPVPVPKPKERYVYTYHVLAASIPMQFFISVEPESGRTGPGKYTFRLTMQANGVERSICDPVDMNLTSLDPRALEFVVFVFPGKASIPAGCLQCFRVWLRTDGADHRIFGEDDLWVGKDPDFNSVAEASFARLTESSTSSQTYHSYVGRAHVTFIVRWQALHGGWYRYSLDYEAGGLGSNLLEDCRLRMDCDPRSISFIIYSVPVQSNPPGATHRVRFWLRSITPFPFPPNMISHSHSQSQPQPQRPPGSPPPIPTPPQPGTNALNGVSFSSLLASQPQPHLRLHANHPQQQQATNHHTHLHANHLPSSRSPVPSLNTSSRHQMQPSPAPPPPPPPPPQALPFNDSYIYQRLWKSDTFKVGAGLDFQAALGHKAALGFVVGGVKTANVVGDGQGDISSQENAGVGGNGVKPNPNGGIEADSKPGSSSGKPNYDRRKHSQ